MTHSRRPHRHRHRSRPRHRPRARPRAGPAGRRRSWSTTSAPRAPARARPPRSRTRWWPRSRRSAARPWPTVPTSPTSSRPPRWCSRRSTPSAASTSWSTTPGFVRDRMLVNTSEEEWDAVIRVHLKGHFAPLRHAGAWWRGEAKEGRQRVARVVNTSSGAGMQGSIGQTTYSAAKAGIAGMTLVAAAELGRYGVNVNAIAPVGAHPDDRGCLPTRSIDAPTPDGDNSPVVAWLASADCDITGRVIEIEGWPDLSRGGLAPRTSAGPRPALGGRRGAVRQYVVLVGRQRRLTPCTGPELSRPRTIGRRWDRRSRRLWTRGRPRGRADRSRRAACARSGSRGSRSTPRCRGRRPSRGSRRCRHGDLRGAVRNSTPPPAGRARAARPGRTPATTAAAREAQPRSQVPAGEHTVLEPQAERAERAPARPTRARSSSTASTSKGTAQGGPATAARRARCRCRRRPGGPSCVSTRWICAAQVGQSSGSAYRSQTSVDAGHSVSVQREGRHGATLAGGYVGGRRRRADRAPARPVRNGQSRERPVTSRHLRATEESHDPLHRHQQVRLGP